MDWGNCVEGGVATLQCVPVVFVNVIRWTLIFAGIIALFFILISAARYILWGDDTKQVDTARKTLMWAIIGLIVILLSFFMVNFISGTTKVDCIQQFGFKSCE